MRPAPTRAMRLRRGLDEDALRRRVAFRRACFARLRTASCLALPSLARRQIAHSSANITGFDAELSRLRSRVQGQKFATTWPRAQQRPFESKGTVDPWSCRCGSDCEVRLTAGRTWMRTSRLPHLAAFRLTFQAISRRKHGQKLWCNAQVPIEAIFSCGRRI